MEMRWGKVDYFKKGDLFSEFEHGGAEFFCPFRHNDVCNVQTAEFQVNKIFVTGLFSDHFFG